MATTTTTQELLECATNLHFYYGMRTHKLSDVHDMSCMPTLYFIKVALECGISKNTKALAECFPYDRDWHCQADFRGHLQDLLQEDDYKRILGIAGRVTRDALMVGELWIIDLEMYDRYVATNSQTERAKLLWHDDVSKAFLREICFQFVM